MTRTNFVTCLIADEIFVSVCMIAKLGEEIVSWVIAVVHGFV